MRFLRFIKREKGQSMVEFAIILPLLLLLIGPVVDLGRLVYAKTQLQNITGDLLHMVVLENEYSHQDGSFKAIQDKIIQEDTGIPSIYFSDEEKDGYLISKTFKTFIKTEGLDNGLIDIDNIDKYIKLGPVQKGFGHEGKYPKLKKQVRPGEFVDKSELNYIGGYDQYGLDSLGYNRSGFDVYGLPAHDPRSNGNKHKRWKLEGTETFDNETYYREVTVTLPYKLKNITIVGKMIFGETMELKESISGIIYMGGDGRDVAEPLPSQ